MIDKSINKSIAKIAEDRLCLSCGACDWSCPNESISYYETSGGFYIPKVDPVTCTNCGICLNICPGDGFVPALLKKIPSDPFAGDTIKSYVGKSTNPAIYENSQSGGIVTGLLVHALKTGAIGGVLTAEMTEGNPPRPKVVLATSVDDFGRTQKSMYCPVPLLTILEQVRDLGKPVAVVGVSCQIHGLQNILLRLKKFKIDVPFTLGLICDRVLAYTAIDYLLSKSGLEPDAATMLCYRDKQTGGFPGNVHVLNPDKSVVLPASERMLIKQFFTPPRCHLCFDKMNIFADIVLGDPHGIEGVDRVGGESLAVVRTEAGMKIFQSALEHKAVTAREAPYEDILRGQGIDEKRSSWRGYMEAWRDDIGRPLPNYWDKVREHSASPEKNVDYKKHLEHALGLDHYPSREGLIKAAAKHVMLVKLRSVAARLLHAPKSLLGRLLNNRGREA